MQISYNAVKRQIEAIVLNDSCDQFSKVSSVPQVQHLFLLVISSNLPFQIKNWRKSHPLTCNKYV